MQWYQILNIIFIVLISISSAVYLPHILYSYIGLFVKGKTYPLATAKHKFAILICAKNEERVIGNLLDSLFSQDYPRELFDVFVMADCCTDNTAAVARAKGAYTYELTSKLIQGKGETLDKLIKTVLSQHSANGYEAYLFFDADNLVEKHFLLRINDCLDNGERITVCYRSAKNFGDGFFASGTSLLLYREMHFLHPARQALGTSTHMSGTGVMICSDIINNLNGWPYRTLTEDLEFSLDMVCRGERIGFCKDAVFYDEQPVDAKSSDKQRLRWIKGAYQSYRLYAKKLLSGMFSKNGYARFDLFCQMSPMQTALLFTVFAYAAFIAIGYFALNIPAYFAAKMLWTLLGFVGFFFITVMLNTEATVLKSWKHIPATRKQKLLALLGFPIFFADLSRVSIKSLFARDVSWNKTEHQSTKTVNDILKQKNIK